MHIVVYWYIIKMNAFRPVLSGPKACHNTVTLVLFAKTRCTNFRNLQIINDTKL